MATYYWVGGTGTWNNTNAAGNWRTTSGGATLAPAAPALTDSAIFDANSSVGAANISIDSTAKCLAMSNTNANITLTLINNNIGFYANSGITLSAGVFDCASFNLTTSASAVINHTAGVFTAGTGTITIGGISSTGNSIRTINLNSSTLVLSGGATNLTFTGSNLTFNAGTSLIKWTFTSDSNLDRGYVFYDVLYAGNTGITITGANTYHNLTINIAGSVGTSLINIGSSITVQNAFTITQNNTIGSSRKMVNSTISTRAPITITAASVSLIDVDFRDVTGAGAATWSGTRLGDCGGNSGITFDTPKTVYWNLSGSNNYTSNAWALTPTGTPALANFPLPQDTVIFTNNTTSGATISFASGSNVGNIDFSARTLPLTFDTLFSSVPIYGNITLSSSITIPTSSNNYPFYLYGRGTQNITSSGVTIPLPFTQNTVSGTVNFLDNFISTKAYTLTSGVLQTNYSFSCLSFTSFASNSRSISLGSGNMFCTGTGVVFDTSGTTGLTVIGNPTVNVTSSGSTAITVSPGTTVGVSNLFNFNFTGGTYALTLTTSNLFNSLNFTGFSGSLSNTAKSIYGNLTLSPTMTITAGASPTAFAGTSGSQTITANGVTCDIPITLTGTGGTYTLGSALTLGATNGSITHTAGTLNLAGYTLTCKSYSTAAGTKNITFNGGTLTITAFTTTAFNNAQPTGFTTTAGTGTGSISLTGSTAKTFVGGGSTYNCTLNQGGAGALTITGANTFNNITNTVKPATITLPSSTTNTFNNFSLSGTAGNLITINSSTAGTQATISKASGTVSVSYCSIKDSNATGGATWNAFTSNGNVDAGNNLGWVFSLVTRVKDFFAFF